MKDRQLFSKYRESQFRISIVYNEGFVPCTMQEDEYKIRISDFSTKISHLPQKRALA